MSSISFGPRRNVPFSESEKNVLKVCAVLVIVMILTFLFSSCSRTAHMARRDAAIAAMLDEKEQAIKYLEKRNQYTSDLVRAYNHLVHRVWLDKPNYVEDVLTETDEFCEVNDLLSGNWADTFEFYDEKDSIEYHHNLNRAVQIPEPTRSRINSVFYDCN